MSLNSPIAGLLQPLDELVEILKMAAEPSRLRILRVLAAGDLTVTDLTTILGQSQPRVSRHLKLLVEHRLIRRWQEGSWAFFRVNREPAYWDLVNTLLAHLDPNDATLQRDEERLNAVKRERRQRASDYFSQNANAWDKIRSLHAPDSEVEASLLEAVGIGPFNALLDIGTGTGRMLELFAPQSQSALGVDHNREMLAIARANIDSAGLKGAEVRLGDIENLDVGRGIYDLVLIHQVLHFLHDPAMAVAEAVRALSPGGTVAIVDFATHDNEDLRAEHQHLRLGFADDVVIGWLLEAGISDVQTHAVEADAQSSGGSNPLTVKIWVGRDSNYEVAGSARNTELA
ncbi:MAG: metalloregulator ArsR/SmtB family transcription factor [Pseudomonadota bacterium]